MGKLIVLEGTDGSGKTTQLGLLCERLTKEGIGFTKLEYPCYGTVGASLVEHYLHGGLGSDPDSVNPYAASSFFACDRYVDFQTNHRKNYDAGGLFVAGRYTTSNAVHQASKLHGAERIEYLNWLFDYEYNRVGLPKPDLVVFLDLHPDATFENIRTRQGDSGDIHEKDHDYLRHCYSNALDVAERFGWTRIECVKDGVLRSREDIHSEIFSVVSKIL